VCQPVSKLSIASVASGLAPCPARLVGLLITLHVSLHEVPSVCNIYSRCSPSILEPVRPSSSSPIRALVRPLPFHELVRPSSPPIFEPVRPSVLTPEPVHPSSAVVLTLLPAPMPCVSRVVVRRCPMSLYRSCPSLPSLPRVAPLSVAAVARCLTPIRRRPPRHSCPSSPSRSVPLSSIVVVALRVHRRVPHCTLVSFVVAAWSGVYHCSPPPRSARQ